MTNNEKENPFNLYVTTNGVMRVLVIAKNTVRAGLLAQNRFEEFGKNNGMPPAFWAGTNIRAQILKENINEGEWSSVPST